MDTKLSELKEDIARNQEDIVCKRLVEIGVKETLNELTERRFPAVARFVHENGYTYYFYDDRSKEGKFIVAFGPIKSHFDTDKNSVTISFDIKNQYDGVVKI